MSSEEGTRQSHFNLLSYASTKSMFQKTSASVGSWLPKVWWHVTSLAGQDVGRLAIAIRFWEASISGTNGRKCSMAVMAGATPTLPLEHQHFAQSSLRATLKHTKSMCAGLLAISTLETILHSCLEHCVQPVSAFLCCILPFLYLHRIKLNPN